jgi:predicted AAA+ superfamily ATPase
MFVLHFVQRQLKTLGKYYIVDMGLRNHLLMNSESDIGHQIENIVYLELIRRKYRVSIGKMANYHQRVTFSHIATG